MFHLITWILLSSVSIYLCFVVWEVQLLFRYFVVWEVQLLFRYFVKFAIDLLVEIILAILIFHEFLRVIETVE